MPKTQAAMMVRMQADMMLVSSTRIASVNIRMKRTRVKKTSCATVTSMSSHIKRKLSQRPNTCTTRPTSNRSERIRPARSMDILYLA